MDLIRQSSCPLPHYGIAEDICVSGVFGREGVAAILDAEQFEIVT